MAAESEFSCDLDPETKTSLKIYLYRNVTNVETIRNNIINGVWKCAVVKPSLVLDPFQVAVAANRAVLSHKRETMVTRTVFSEILYNLSLSKNISQSLSKFGIEKDSDILVCLLSPESDEGEDILSQIEGEQRPISELSQLTDVKKVKQVYKLNNMKCDDGMLDVIISRLVTKNFVAY